MLRIQYMQDFLIISAPTSKRAEAYLEPSRSSGMELFRKNSLRIKLSSQKGSIVDLQLGFKYASGEFQKMGTCYHENYPLFCTIFISNINNLTANSTMNILSSLNIFP